MNKLKSYAFLVFGALIFTLGFPNIWGVLVPFTPIIGTCILISQLINSQTTKERIAKFLTFNTAITFLSFYWITATLQEFGELPLPIAVLINFFYVFIFSPQFWIFIFLLHILAKKGKDFHTPTNKALRNFLYAAGLTAVEYYIPQQFPVLLGHPWIVISPSLGLAPIFGLPIYSFVSYLIVFEILNFIKDRTFSKFHLITIALFIILNPLTVQKEQEAIEPVNIRMVQANISNFLKVDSEKGTYASVAQVLNQYEELSLKPFSLNSNPIDLIIWPETAFPFPIDSDKSDITKTIVPHIFRRIVAAQKSEMLFGGYDHFKDNADQSYFMTEYNSALQLNAEGELKDVYHKQVLIPFGETLPFGPLNKFASELLPNMAFFAEGRKNTLFKMPKGAKFSASICYEILRPEFLRNYLNNLKERPQFMVNLTNDSWYGNTAEPEQHLFLTKWRSLEFNLPMLRSTNTGITTQLDRFGQEVERLDYGMTGNLDIVFSPAKNTDPTPFQTYGFSLMVLIWLGYFIFHLLLLKLKR